MWDDSSRNELLKMLREINDLVSGLQKNETAENTSRLLKAYEVKLKILEKLSNF